MSVKIADINQQTRQVVNLINDEYKWIQPITITHTQKLIHTHTQTDSHTHTQTDSHTHSYIHITQQDN